MRGISIGGSSILAVFVLLSLIVLATLALLSSLTSLNLTKQLAYSNIAYHNASNVAEEKLKAINYIVNTSETLQNISDTLYDIGATLNDNTIQYYVPINDSLYINVKLHFIYDTRQLSISSWVTNVEYDPYLYGSDILPLWIGN